MKRHLRNFGEVMCDKARSAGRPTYRSERLERLVRAFSYEYYDGLPSTRQLDSTVYCLSCHHQYGAPLDQRKSCLQPSFLRLSCALTPTYQFSCPRIAYNRRYSPSI